MSTSDQRLGIELRFRPHSDPLVWARVVERVTAWQPLLRPAWVQQLSNPTVPEPISWSEALKAELASKCASAPGTGWTLMAETGPVGAISFDVRRLEVFVSIAVPRPSEPLPESFFRLLHTLLDVHPPALGMLVDLNSRLDAEVVMQGLGGIAQVSPLLYLDALAVEAAGGADRLRAAPCDVINAPGGGLLLIVRPDPWAQMTADDTKRVKAVQHYLRMSPNRPVAFT